MQQHPDIWSYQQEAWATTDLVKYDVEAVDGSIGHIDEANNDTGISYIVVDTGPWIFGKKVMLPAGVIDRVDLDDRRVYVNRSKEEIKNAPEFDENRYTDDAYRAELRGYYGDPVGSRRSDSLR
jgi:hypothetical protein